MGICRDKAVNYLKGLKLNTVTQPSSDIKPLALIGEYRGAIAIIGRLDQLVSSSSVSTPTTTTGVAAEISGKKSSKLPLEIGINILGTLIGAMGGNLGVNASYNSAKTVEFTFKNVNRERANVVEIGDYLLGGEIRWNHLILQKYLFGKGNLYVITEVVRSNEIGVTAYSKTGANLGVDVPVIQQAVGGKVKVGVENESTKSVAYKGDKELVFGFVAIELSALENAETGELSLGYEPVKEGTIALSVGDEPSYAAFAPLSGLPEADPETLGES
jgi:hypothetical protein